MELKEAFTCLQQTVQQHTGDYIPLGIHHERDLAGIEYYCAWLSPIDDGIVLLRASSGYGNVTMALSPDVCDNLLAVLQRRKRQR